MAVKGLDFTNDETDKYILNYVYAKVGMVDRAREHLERMLELEDKKPVLRYIVETYVALGETDRAIEWLEKVFLEGSSYVEEIPTRRTLDPLRDDPRYIELVERMGLEL
jgi:hypothetical protein